MGGGIGKVLKAVSTGGLSLLAEDILTPDAPDASSAPTETPTGAIAKEGEGKTFDESEAESRRKAVRRKRLGTKALQIPLEKTSTGVATSAGTGIKV